MLRSGILAAINVLLRIGAIVKTLPTTYRGLAVFGQSMQIIEAQQNGFGSFTKWGLRNQCVQWFKRNS